MVRNFILAFLRKKLLFLLLKFLNRNNDYRISDNILIIQDNTSLSSETFSRLPAGSSVKFALINDDG